MANSKSRKKFFNMVYGLGAAVVILGALFKIAHWPYGTLILTIGMIVEALVFAVSAFEPVEEEYDWTKVYPELVGEEGGDRKSKAPQNEEVQSLLSQKLDEMLEQANLDSEKMSRLATSIENFAGAAENIAPAANSITASTRYSEQLALAANQMETLNSLYKVQMENAERHAELNQETVEKTQKLKEQMESLAANLSSLNGVYGGMLSAMHGQ